MVQRMTRRAVVLGVPAVVGGAVFMPGCTVGTVTQVVQNVAAAAETVLSALGGAGVIPQPLAGLISSYLQAVGTGVQQTSMELASMDTTAQKRIKIISIWVGVTLAALPVCGLAGVTGPCVPGSIMGLLDLVKSAVQALVNYFTPAQLTAAQLTRIDQYKLTHGDKHELGKLASRGQAIILRAGALR